MKWGKGLQKEKYTIEHNNALGLQTNIHNYNLIILIIFKTEKLPIFALPARYI